MSERDDIMITFTEAEYDLVMEALDLLGAQLDDADDHDGARTVQDLIDYVSGCR